MKGYDLVAHALVGAGLDTAFGVMGDGNMHWVARYRDLPTACWCPAWHEAGAVWMAAGYATATGRVGLATVTMGPGLAQALPALTAVARARGAVVVLTAELGSTTLPHAQAAPQAEWSRACGAAYLTADCACAFPAALAEAIETAQGGTPCVLAVRLDAFAAEAGEQAALPPPPGDRAGAGGARTGEIVGDLAGAVDLLTAAQRPLVVVGRGVLASGCLPAALELGRRIGAVFATTVGGRCALPDEPFDLGLTGMMASPVAREITGDADVVLVLGAALDQYNTDGGRLGTDPGRLVRLDHRPADRLWNPPGVTPVSLTGELPVALDLLTRALPAATARPGSRTALVRRRLREEADRQASLAAADMPDGPNPWAVVAELGGRLPADAHIVVGIGHFWYFVLPGLSPSPDRQFQAGCGFALIGQALPLGIGAAAGQRTAGRRPVVVIDGDGSMAMNLQELHTAVRLGVDLLVVVLNNASYGSEFHKLLQAGLDPGSSNAELPIAFAGVAQAFGATGRRAADLGELRAALDELVPLPGVRLIDAAIARSPMSEVYQRQHAAQAQPSR